MRVFLLGIVFFVIFAIALLFRKIGLGEMALVAAVLSLAFGVESVRFVVKQFLRGYGK